MLGRVGKAGHAHDRVVDERARDEQGKAAELHPAPHGPRLAIVLGAAVKDDERAGPDDNRAQRVDERAHDGRDALGNGEAAKVVKGNGGEIEENHGHEDAVLAHHLERLERVFVPAAVLARDKVEDGQDDKDHDDEAKEALHADDLERSNVAVLQVHLLDNHLHGVAQLAGNDEREAEHGLAVEPGRPARVVEQRRGADDAEPGKDDGQTERVEAKELAANWTGRACARTQVSE